MNALSDGLFALGLLVGLVVLVLHRVVPIRAVALGSALALSLLCASNAIDRKTLPALVLGALALFTAAGELVLHLVLRARQARDWSRR